MNHPYPISEGKDAIAQRAIEQRAEWERRRSDRVWPCGTWFLRMLLKWPRVSAEAGDRSGEERQAALGTAAGRDV